MTNMYSANLVKQLGILYKLNLNLQHVNMWMGISFHLTTKEFPSYFDAENSAVVESKVFLFY